MIPESYKLQILLILLLSLPSSNKIVNAQNSEKSNTQHYIGYEPGIIQLREMNLIPKVHSGMINNLTYVFEKANINYQSFIFVFGYSRPKTAIERNEGISDKYDKNNGHLLLQYSYNLSIFNGNNIKYYLGPKLAYSYSLSYYHGWDSHAYWGNYFSLGPNNYLLINLNDNRSWAATLNLSLFGFYNRPDKMRLYKVEDWSFGNIIKITNKKYTAGYWTNAFQIQLSAEYRTVLEKRKFAVKYNFFYSRIKSENSEPLFELIHRIGAIISL